jgi:hypothetical protein
MIGGRKSSRSASGARPGRIAAEDTMARGRAGFGQSSRRAIKVRASLRILISVWFLSAASAPKPVTVCEILAGGILV